MPFRDELGGACKKDLKPLIVDKHGHVAAIQKELTNLFEAWPAVSLCARREKRQSQQTQNDGRTEVWPPGEKRPAA